MANFYSSIDEPRSVRFGTDGFRGVIGAEFTMCEVELISSAMAVYMSGKKIAPIVNICFDRRFASDRFAERASDTLNHLGVSTRVARVPVPTPALSCEMRNSNASLGVMITASHNPYDYNGFKIKTSDGASAPGPVISEIQAIVDRMLAAGEGPKAAREKLGRPAEGGREAFDPVPGYIEGVKKSVDMEKTKSLEGRFLINPMYGAQAGLFETLAAGAGMAASCEEIFFEHNPLFPGFNPEPIAPNLTRMSAYMKAENAANPFFAGFAFDGDGDRIAAMTADGTFVSPQSVFAILLRHLIRNRGAKGAVAKTVSVTALVSAIAAKHGIEIIETPIGFKYIADMMLDPARKVMIGGEESGGIGITSYMPERDSLYLSMMLMEAMAYEKKDLAGILADLESEFGAFRYDRDDYRMTRGEFERVKAILASGAPKTIDGIAVAATNAIDGYKYFLEGGGWILYRFSGTEPVLRIYAETADAGRTASLLRYSKEWLGL